MILGEDFLGDKEGEDLSFTHLKEGEGLDRLGITKGVAGGIVSEGEVEAIAHEIEIALNGFIGDFELAAQLLAIDGLLVGKEFMETVHAGERGAAVAPRRRERFFLHRTAYVLPKRAG